MSLLHEPRHEPAQLNLLRAAIFKWLARAFAYPAPEHTAALARDFQQLKMGGLKLCSPIIAFQFKQTAAILRSSDEQALAADYTRLFLPSGPISLHETAYGDSRRIAGRAAELADISGFYSAFGFVLSESDPELPDHLCTELEFYSLLLVKCAYALSFVWNSQATISRQAQAGVLQDHLGRWVGAFARSLADHETATPYARLAQTLETIVMAECRRLRVKSSLVEGRLPHDMMQEDMFICPRQGSSC